MTRQAGYRNDYRNEFSGVDEGNCSSEMLFDCGRGGENGERRRGGRRKRSEQADGTSIGLGRSWQEGATDYVETARGHLSLKLPSPNFDLLRSYSLCLKHNLA